MELNRDFTTLKILILNLFGRHADVQIKTECLHQLVLTMCILQIKPKLIIKKNTFNQNNSKLQMVSITTKLTL